MSDKKAYDAVLIVPFGALGIILREEGLWRIDFLSGKWRSLRKEGRAVAEVVSAIEGYLVDPNASMAPPMQPQGTPFQQRVWRHLRQIPVGEALSYGELAEELGSSPRAVGNACRANPCPVVVPCHRVVSAGGLGGFAGQRDGEKLAIKRWLLAHEGYLSIGE